jgi:membrane-associated PAP2 superfamily phosphatase
MIIDNHAVNWRARDWEWASLAAVLIMSSMLFALWPQLDLLAARVMHGPNGFRGGEYALVQMLYHGTPWVGRVAFAVALIIGLTAVVSGKFPSARWSRRMCLLGLSLLFGTGLLVNGVLKEGSGRARPVAVQEFGGPAMFTPAFRPTNQCRTNCSFVSGHAATGFALGAVGLLGAPAMRRRWLLIGIVAGSIIGLGRMSQGGHFLSDVIFSGIAMWGCNLTIRKVWLRLALRRLAYRNFKRSQKPYDQTEASSDGTSAATR